MKYLVNYVATLILFVAIDFVWLKLSSDRLYRPIMGDMLADKPVMSAAASFYLLYILGVVIFVGSFALRTGEWTNALFYGGLFGFFAYATYDLTNQATLRNWSLQLTIADMVWGTLLTGVTATLAFFVTRAVVRD